MIRKREFSYKLFDLLFLKGKEGDIEGIQTLSEEPVNFEYTQFDDNFISNNKK